VFPTLQITNTPAGTKYDVKSAYSIKESLL